MMKIFKNTLAFVFLAILISTSFFVRGQDFQAIGLRLGSGSGIVYKSYINYENAFELIAYNKEKGFLATALYVFNEPVSMMYSDRFFVYYGFGAHAGYYRNIEYFKTMDNNGNEVIRERLLPFPNLGFDVVGGIEYRLENYPVIVCLDFKPTLNIFGPYKHFGNNFFDFGLSFFYKF